MSHFSHIKQAAESTTDPFTGWEELYERPLMDSERREISHNLGSFFAILNEWREEEAREAEKAQKGEAENAQEKSPDE